jgi:single-strand DNA-binding protein
MEVMESAINKIILSGYAATNAEIKLLAGNQKLVKINLGVNEYYKNKSGEEIKKTQWINLVFWNSLADEAERGIKKGSKITVEGKLNTNNYITKEGAKRFSTEILVSELKVI